MGAKTLMSYKDAVLCNRLSRAEIRVIEALVTGRSTKEAARSLGGMSPRTIDYHTNNVYARFGFNNRVQLCLWFNGLPLYLEESA